MKEKSRQSVYFVVDARKPCYPTNPFGCRHNPDRRRFLFQVSASGGAIAFGAGVPMTSAQGIEVDFSVLEGHDRLVPSPSPSLVGELGVAARSSVVGDGAVDGTDGPVEATGEPPTPDTEPVDGLLATLTENRALWVDPGYLLLIQWTRPEDDETPVAALEASTQIVADYLELAVVDTEALHETLSLHAIELGLRELLNPVVLPARIEVIHLDHDCEAVCGPLRPDPLPRLGGSVAVPPY